MTSVPQTVPPGRGWRHWGDTHPSPLTTVEAWRREWQSVEVLRLADIHPATNVWGLYWRPLQPPRLEPEVRRLPETITGRETECEQVPPRRDNRAYRA